MPAEATLTPSYAGHVKGAGSMNTLSVLREEMGDAAYREFMAGAPVASRAIVQDTILAVESVPLAAWLPLMDYIFEQRFARDVAAMKAFSRRCCERDFSTLYRVLIRLGSPGFVIERTASSWRRYHDVGELTVVARRDEGPRHVVHVRLADFPPWPLERFTLLAYIEQVLTMSAARELRARETHYALTSTLLVEWEISYLR